MAQYFFHLRDGHDVVIDAEGQSIVDRSLVGVHALREARAMISQDALGGRINLNQYIEVRDEAGKLVHQLPFRDAVVIVDRA